MASEYVLQMKDIQKEYFSNVVLKGVDLSVYPGEIHALLGENGAGKSTLMNVLFGMPVIHSTGGFSGQIYIEGKKVDIHSPEEAMNIGIGMVHQEFMLIKGFSITENIKLNREVTKPNFMSRFFGKEALKFLDFNTMNQHARHSLDQLDMNMKEETKVEGLPVGYMQFIEIAREIDKKNVKVLVFDEPTAVLTEGEASNLIKAMKSIAASGIAILFITHRLEEVINASDRVTILRDGEWVITKDTKDTNVEELASLMVGRKIQQTSKNHKKVSLNDQKTILRMKNFHVNMPGEEVKGINLSVKEGEILGIGGLAGQGKIGIANGMMGLYPSKGEVYLGEEKIELNEPKKVLKKGVAFVSEDRRGVGLLLDESIEYNIVATALQVKNKFLKSFVFFDQIDHKSIRTHALKMIKDLDIRCVGPHQITRRLSGGNQQKVCIARALTLDPKVLFVSEPTRGIDIGAKKLVLDVLVKLNQKYNMTIIVTSSELAELRSICHRIAIISEGKVEGILEPTASDKDFGLMMAGQYQKFYRKGV